MSQQQEDIDNYYKLKSEYVDKNGIVSTVIQLPAEQRVNFKCIKCKRPGGTIFEETPHILHAVCGADPKCDLDMSVRKTGPVVLMPVLLGLLRNKLEAEKTKLIELKIKHALGSVSDDDVISQFEEGSELLRRLSAAVASIDERLLSVTDSPMKHSNINRLKAEIYTATQEYKNNLREFVDTGRDAFLVDALEQQENVITPLVNELRDTLYARNMVEYNPDMDEYVLIQQPYTIEEMEVPFLPELHELLFGIANQPKITVAYNIDRRVNEDEQANAGFL